MPSSNWPMLMGIRALGRALSAMGSRGRRIGAQSHGSASGSRALVEVTVFRLIFVLPGARFDRGSRP